MSTEQDQGLTEHPLWRKVANDLIDAGITYGQKWPIEWFEKELRCSKETTQFRFAISDLRSEIFNECGLYIAACDSGKSFQVLESRNHEDVAARFDRNVKRYAKRSVHIRYKTLTNPQAQLTDAERAIMEKNAEHASVRLALISRSKTVAHVVTKHAPKLLAMGQK